MTGTPVTLTDDAGRVRFEGLQQGGGGGSQPQTHWVDCGVVTVADVLAAGALELVAAAAGRLIVGVRFGPDGYEAPTDFTCWYITPNTTGFAGFGYLGSSGPFDTPGVVANGEGGPPAGDAQGDGKRQILDVGPLVAGVNTNAEFRPAGAWQANHAYALNDYVIDSNGNLQVVLVNGVSGGSEPVWETTPAIGPGDGTTVDGTAQWTFQNAGPFLGSAHVYAEVLDGDFPLPPYPASLAFTTPPADGTAGATLAPIIVTVLDQNGDPYTLYDQAVVLEIVGVGTTNAGVGNATFATTSAGVATFDAYAIEDAGNYVLRARLYPAIVATIVLSDPFTISAP